MVFRNFVRDNLFFARTPTGQKRWFSGILARFGLGHEEKFRDWAENTKMQFPGARGTFGGKFQKFLPEIALFFIFYVLADRTPRGGKSRNTGFLGHCGLGQPLALREIPGEKRKSTISRVQLMCYQKDRNTPLQLGPNTQS